jgi:hypothetical protein
MDRLDDDAALTVRQQLAWFTTREAEDFAARSKHKSVAPVFGYAATGFDLCRQCAPAESWPPGDRGGAIGGVGV